MKLSEFVRTSSTLKHIKFQGKCRLAPDLVSMLFDTNQTYVSKVDSIELTPSGLHAAYLKHILEFMKSSSTNLHLNISNHTGGACLSYLLIEQLKSGLRISTLNILGRGVGDDVLRWLLSTRGARHLVSLNLAHNRITIEGLRLLIQLLNREGVCMKKVEFKFNCVTLTDAGTMLVESLSNSSSLRYIGLENSRSSYRFSHPGDLIALKRDFMQKICDMSSFDALYGSNHNLYSFGTNFKHFINCNPSAWERQVLAINERDATDGEKIKNKLRATYFRGEFDTQKFALMDVKLMPFALELVTISDKYRRKNEYTGDWDHIMTSTNFDGIYRLIRNCHIPEMFKFPRPEDTIDQLQIENVESLKCDNASLEERIAQLEQENEKLRSQSPNLPNKRPKMNM